MTLKLTCYQLKQAAYLADQISRFEMLKDEEGTTTVRIGMLIGEIPIPREAVVAGANAEISRCHEELKAMGISLMPSETKAKFAVGVPIGRETVFNVLDAPLIRD